MRNFLFLASWSGKGRGMKIGNWVDWSARTCHSNISMQNSDWNKDFLWSKKRKVDVGLAKTFKRRKLVGFTKQDLIIIWLITEYLATLKEIAKNLLFLILALKKHTTKVQLTKFQSSATVSQHHTSFSHHCYFFSDGKNICLLCKPPWEMIPIHQQGLLAWAAHGRVTQPQITLNHCTEMVCMIG